MSVLVTTSFGYILGANGKFEWGKFLFLLLGVAFVCGGASILNHYLERDIDSKMKRTRNRPLPTGRIAANNALLLGVICVLIGVFVLYYKIDLLTSFLSLLSTFLYVLVYTPLKRISWLNTSLGAIPGALPPMGGWVAATGELSVGAWVLFFILFIWQHPHFFAIAWMFREDYRLGGFKMLPVIEPDGKRTFFQVMLFSILLIPCSLLPVFFNMTGKIYFWGTLSAGILLLMTSLYFVRTKTDGSAKQLLKATVFYLPVLLLLIIFDSSF